MPAELPYIPPESVARQKGLAIKSVAEESIAEDLGLLPGEKLHTINGHEVKDMIDVSFQETGEEIEILVERADGTLELFEIEKDEDEPLGLTFEAIRYKTCANKCVFCFIDQNAPEMRSTLFFKDEDYRLSFLHGNYVTLTNMKEKDFQRVLTQRLSPIFVSVHSLDPATREVLLGVPERRPFMETMHRLLDGGITLHGQVVLCPGINDGDDLMATIDGLAKYWPGVGSLSVVPVGLTRFRKGLHDLRPVSRDEARYLIERVNAKGEELRQRFGEAFVYLSDEFYLLAEWDYPPASFYDKMPQLSNGVGLLAKFEQGWRACLEELQTALAEGWSWPDDGHATILTGEYAAPLLQQRIDELTAIAPEARISVRGLENRFYGPLIKIAGLMTGQDILRSLKEQPPAPGPILLPTVMLNTNRSRFLDNVTPEAIEAEIGRPLTFVEPEAESLFEAVSGLVTEAAFED